MKIEIEIDENIRKLLKLMIKERQLQKGEILDIETLCKELVFKSVKYHHPYFRLSIEREKEIILEGQNYKFKKYVGKV